MSHDECSCIIGFIKLVWEKDTKLCRIGLKDKM